MIYLPMWHNYWRRCGRKLHEKVLGDAIYVLQHQQRVRLREPQRLQLLAELERTDADVDDADTGARGRRLHIALLCLRGPDAPHGPA